LNINIHIERLVLDGLPVARHEGSLVQAAVEAELARLLTAQGLPPNLMSGGAMPSVPGGAIQFGAQSSPAHLGKQIARAVHGGLSK
jgi:hypothetical protein